MNKPSIYPYATRVFIQVPSKLFFLVVLHCKKASLPFVTTIFFPLPNTKLLLCTCAGKSLLFPFFFPFFFLTAGFMQSLHWTPGQLLLPLLSYLFLVTQCFVVIQAHYWLCCGSHFYPGNVERGHHSSKWVWKGSKEERTLHGLLLLLFVEENVDQTHRESYSNKTIVLSVCVSSYIGNWL